VSLAAQIAAGAWLSTFTRPNVRWLRTAASLVGNVAAIATPAGTVETIHKSHSASTSVCDSHF